MKRVLMMVLCAALCFQMTACGLNLESFQKDKWVDEGAAKLGEDIRSSQFVLGGEVYTFPMALSDWLDRGWHISNNYDNKDSFELKPGYESTEFELFNENGEYVEVCVLNISDKSAKPEECLVSYLYISSSQDLKLVLPAGINKSSKPADIRAAYGDADIDKSGNEFFEAYYNYTTEDDWICQIKLSAIDNNYTIDPFRSVSFSISSTTEAAEFYENASGEDGCRRYIDTSLRAGFYGDFNEYVENHFSTQENAEAFYESEVNYYASCVIYYVGINEEALDEATVEEFREIARQVLAKTKWEITNLSVATEHGTLNIDLYPTDFIDLIDDDLGNVISELQAKYAEVDVDSLESQSIEQDYAEMVLNAIRGRVEEAQVKRPVSKLYIINYSEGILSSDDWEEIDSILMDMR